MVLIIADCCFYVVLFCDCLFCCASVLVGFGVWLCFVFCVGAVVIFVSGGGVLAVVFFSWLRFVICGYLLDSWF